MQSRRADFCTKSILGDLALRIVLMRLIVKIQSSDLLSSFQVRFAA